MFEGGPITFLRLNEDGSHDHTFGVRGVIEVPIGERLVTDVFGLSPLADGGWLTVGRYLSYEDESRGLVLLRQDKDGALDEFFGEGGMRFIDNKNPELAAVFQQQPETNELEGQKSGNRRSFVSEQSDGKIVILTGYLLVRLNADASLDKSFNKTGFVRVALKSEHVFTSPDACAVHGREIVVCGSFNPRVGSDPMGLFVMRFKQDGSVDEKFGNDGEMTFLSPDDGFISLRDMTVRESDGRIVAVGHTTKAGHGRGVIVVLNASGSFNQVFNNGQPLYSDMLPQGLHWLLCEQWVNGSIIVAGGGWLPLFPGNNSALIARYDAKGDLDTSFNNQGWTEFDDPRGHESLLGLTMMSDGRIVNSGVFYVKTDPPFPNPASGWVARYLA